MIEFLRYLKYLPLRLKLKFIGYSFGKNFILGKEVNIKKLGFKAGDNVYIGQYSYIGPNTEIGNFCMLSDYINIIGEDHVFNKVGTPIILSGVPTPMKKTIIEDDVWIGHGVTIMKGVKIGEGSIIAANSVVTKDIEPYSINAGIPTKQIKMRFDSESIKIHSNILERYRNYKDLSIFKG
jgi:acetyltransferase-like isoleucine patch superfamily enzyme